MEPRPEELIANALVLNGIDAYMTGFDGEHDDYIEYLRSQICDDDYPLVIQLAHYVVGLVFTISAITNTSPVDAWMEWID